MGVSFVTVYKMAEPVAQQMRNCVCKTQTATTGTRPPLVASQYGRTIVVLVSQNGKHLSYPVVVVVALLFYVHGKHLRSCRDGQLT